MLFDWFYLDLDVISFIFSCQFLALDEDIAILLTMWTNLFFVLLCGSSEYLLILYLRSQLGSDLWFSCLLVFNWAGINWVGFILLFLIILIWAGIFELLLIFFDWTGIVFQLLVDHILIKKIYCDHCRSAPLKAILIWLFLLSLRDDAEHLIALFSLRIVWVVTNVIAKKLYIKFGHEIGIVKVFAFDWSHKGFTGLIVEAGDTKTSYALTFCIILFLDLLLVIILVFIH